MLRKGVYSTERRMYDRERSDSRLFRSLFCGPAVRLEVLLFSEDTSLVTYETDLRTCRRDCVREANSLQETVVAYCSGA